MIYALIGCGRIATNHIAAAVENNLTIGAVCDIVPERMEQLLEKNGLHKDSSIRRYTDYREMLEVVQPRLVAIATESGCHAPIALDCIDKGCHVIVEKPIALSLTDADEMIRRAQARGIVASACHQNRFNTAIGHIRQALEEGRFGRLSHGSVHVRWNRGESYYHQAPWRGTWAQDGGALMNQSIHGIDLLRWLMGDDIEQVFAYTARQFHDYIQCEDIGMAVVKFQNGALGSIEGTTNVFPHNLEETLYLFGEHGTAKAGGKSANTLETWRFADRRTEDDTLSSGFGEETANVYGNGHIRLYADVVAAVSEGRPPYVDLQAGRRALELVLAIYQSAATGTPVKLPLTAGQTLDFTRQFG